VRRYHHVSRALTVTAVHVPGLVDADVLEMSAAETLREDRCAALLMKRWSSDLAEPDLIGQGLGFLGLGQVESAPDGRRWPELRYISVTGSHVVGHGFLS